MTWILKKVTITGLQKSRDVSSSARAVHNIYVGALV